MITRLNNGRPFLAKSVRSPHDHGHHPPFSVSHRYPPKGVVSHKCPPRLPSPMPSHPMPSHPMHRSLQRTHLARQSTFPIITIIQSVSPPFWHYCWPAIFFLLACLLHTRSGRDGIESIIIAAIAVAVCE